MGRGRVQLKRIENKINRQVTFSKRRMGLVKKAHEISVLCDAEVALIIFSARGKMFDYASNSSMEKILERYERHCCAEREASLANTISQENATVEQNKLKARIEMLQRSQRHLLGEELHSLSLKELNVLEPQIEAGLKQIRARKDQLMVDSIAELQRKSNEMELQNKELEKKLKEYEVFWQQHKRSHSSSPPSLGRPPSLPLLHWSSQEEEERKTEDQNRPIIPPWMLKQ